MSEQSTDMFTIDEVGEVLGGIPLDDSRIGLIVGALHEQAERRSVEAAEETRKDTMAMLAHCHQYIESGSDSNIEGYYDRLKWNSLTFLEMMDGIETPTEHEKLAIEATAITYIYLRSENDEMEDSEVDTIECSGVDIDALVLNFTNIIKETEGINDGSEESKYLEDDIAADGIKALYDWLESGNEINYQQLVKPPMQRLYDALKVDDEFKNRIERIERDEEEGWR